MRRSVALRAIRSRRSVTSPEIKGIETKTVATLSANLLSVTSPEIKGIETALPMRTK
ncbi:hypothetical protein ACCAA_180042 [Candidatus Accumulibacter aalborgensis]|uniref:Uncharacterized protein n=1 Tax=Candidatus Accumulibacter aalborgensis TaxID=1860102 RepID=A0A1A8XHU3_9PROT|nr:hypothetical protein ACCAA_180042 [Candidatus Accumulibacter aalborgensis]